MRLGSADYSSPVAIGPKISRVLAHEKYNASNYQNDIALIEANHCKKLKNPKFFSLSVGRTPKLQQPNPANLLANEIQRKSANGPL